MHFFALIALVAPLMGMASPIETRQNKECCYQAKEAHDFIWRATEDGQFLATLGWCTLDIVRDPTDPDNCEKGEHHKLGGYCNPDGYNITVIECPP